MNSVLEKNKQDIIDKIVAVGKEFTEDAAFWINAVCVSDEEVKNKTTEKLTSCFSQSKQEALLAEVMPYLKEREVGFVFFQDLRDTLYPDRLKY